MIPITEYKTKEQQRAFYNKPEWRGPDGLRLKILARDNYECQWYKREGRVSTNVHTILEVDHIKEIDEFPELALEEDNLRTLCKDCHNKRHKRFNYKPRNNEKKWDDEWW